MSRPSRNSVMMRTAFIWAERSTCSRLNVGAVFAREGRILVQGYNGAPAGLPHCDHECNCETVQFEGGVPLHASLCNSQKPCDNAVHAEQSAIAWAARVGVSLEGSFLYCTHQPCRSCAQSIINAGVEAILFVEEYRLTDGVELLERAGLKVLRCADPRDRLNR